MLRSILLLLVLAADPVPKPQDPPSVPWENYLPWSMAVAAVTILWRTSEAKNAKIIDLTERAVAALNNNTSALSELKDALNKDK